MISNKQFFKVLFQNLNIPQMKPTNTPNQKADAPIAIVRQLDNITLKITF